MSKKPPDSNVTVFPVLTLVGKDAPVIPPPVADVPPTVGPEEDVYRSTDRQRILYSVAQELRLGRKAVVPAQWIAAANMDRAMEGHKPITITEFKRWCEDKAFLDWFYAPLIYEPNEGDRKVSMGLLYEVLTEAVADGKLAALQLKAQMEGLIKRVEAEAPVDVHAQLEDFRKRGEVAPPPPSPAASKWRTGTGEK